MRWKAVAGWLAFVSMVVSGCQQKVFLTETDLNNYSPKGMPTGLESDLSQSSVIVANRATNTNAPATPLHPERDIRYVSLSECIAIALEQGTIGDGGLNGTNNTTLIGS